MSIKEYLEKNEDVKYIIFGGKGGLGKTTLSAATACWLAKQGKKTVVFSTDPQASLTDIFEQSIFGKGEVEIAPNLYALEIDADRRIAGYQEEIRNKIKEMYGITEIPEEIEDYIKASVAEPAMAESATFDAMIELMESKRYDFYIFDMMPHGHAIRFLGMAKILDAWIDKVVEVRKKAREYTVLVATLTGKRESEEDKILSELDYIRSRLCFVSDMIRDRKHTAFFYVLIPEGMPILDTKKAIEMFRAFDVPLSGVIVNQVYPAGLLDDPRTPSYLRNRILAQQKYMDVIKKEFKGLIYGVVPMFDQEPKGLDMLKRVAGILFKEA